MSIRLTSTLDPAGDLKAGKLHVDCVSIVITRMDGSDESRGPGYISQGEHSDFEVVAYVAGSGIHHFLGALSDDQQAGRLIAPAESYHMVATDLRGEQWEADRIVAPSHYSGTNEGGYVVRARCKELRHVRSNPYDSADDVLTLLSFEKVDFPATASTNVSTVVGGENTYMESRWDVAQRKIDDLEFEVSSEGGFRIRVCRPKPLPRLAEQRISESVGFTLGFLPQWNVIRRESGPTVVTRYRSPDRRVVRPRQYPPYVLVGDRATASEVWRLFEEYLNFVLKDDTHECHPLSLEFMAVHQMRTSPVEARALTVSVAVEIVMSKFFIKDQAPAPSVVDEVDNLIQYVKNWPGSESIRVRALGSIGSLKRIRPEDMLRELVARNVIDNLEHRSWKTLRNTAAHGGWKNFDEDRQHLFDLTGHVDVLLNKLAFHLMGYEGAYTDYGTRGWPIKRYTTG